MERKDEFAKELNGLASLREVVKAIADNLADKEMVAPALLAAMSRLQLIMKERGCKPAGLACLQERESGGDAL
jgi:hypothetical protein